MAQNTSDINNLHVLFIYGRVKYFENEYFASELAKGFYSRLSVLNAYKRLLTIMGVGSCSFAFRVGGIGFLQN
jgi:hypothetical protein